MLLISHNSVTQANCLVIPKSRLQFIKYYLRYVIMQKFWNKLVAVYITQIGAWHLSHN